MPTNRRDSSVPDEHVEEVQRHADPRAPRTPANLAGAALGRAGNAAMGRLLAGAGTGGSVQRDAATATEGGSLDQDVAQQIEVRRGGGSPLPAAIREPLSQQLGADLGHVRVHSDATADGLSRSVQAQAFTSGSDIFFSSGSFQPSSTAGRELIAHEAVHVVQQGAGGSAQPARAATTVSDPADAAETEAYRLAPLLARGIDHPETTDVAAPEAGQTAVVHRDPAPAPAPVDPNAQATTPAFDVEWTWMIKYGSLDRKLDRNENLIWVGDNLAIFARVSVPNAKDLGLKLQYAGVGIGGSAGDAAVTKPTWIDDHTAMWEISGTTPGKRFMGFTVANSEWGNERQNNFDLTVAGDHTVFKRRCGTAETLVNTKYAAGREWFMNTFLAYKAGYERQSAALERQAGANRLLGELLLGVLFAGVGGAVGGAVANMSRVAKAAEVLKKSNAVAAGAFTDTAKDMAKYVARIPTQLGGGGGSQGTAGAGPSTDPAAAGVAQGEGAAAAVDPLNWMATLDAKISGERATIGALLLGANLKADAIAVTQPDYAFDFDPVEVVETSATIDGKSIDALGEVPTSLEYERACWEVWLANYAYKIDYTPEHGPLGMELGSWDVRENVGGKLEDEIDRVAGEFGEKGEDWIKRYGGPLKAKLDAEAAAINKAAR
jgi:hypothetical protein